MATAPESMGDDPGFDFSFYGVDNDEAPAWSWGMGFSDQDLEVPLNWNHDGAPGAINIPETMNGGSGSGSTMLPTSLFTPPPHPSGEQQFPATSKSGHGRTTSSQPANYLHTPQSEILDDLPPQPRLRQLVDIFFQKYHHLLPCVHRKTFEAELETSENLSENPLLFAILAVATAPDPDPTVSNQGSMWIDRATDLCDGNIRTLIEPLQTLQASIWISFHRFSSAYMSEMWTYLGKACRYVGVLGWNRIDSGRPQSPFSPSPKSELEVEERRQTVWQLYLLDRVLSSLNSWPMVLYDRNFLVNFPIDQEAFQAGELEVCLYLGVPPASSADFNVCQTSASEPFTVDLAALSEVKPGFRAKDGPTRWIYKIIVLLGRIVSFHNDLHGQDEADFHLLERAVTRFSLNCPTGPQSILEAKDGEVIRMVWLNALLQQCLMLLYHPTVSPEISGDRQEQSPGLLRCLNATKNTLAIMKEAANRSPESLLNPFLGLVYLLGCRFLVIRRQERADLSIQEELDFLFILVQRMSSHYPLITAKWRFGMLHDLRKDEAAVARIRVGNGTYLGEECVGFAGRLAQMGE